jgi:transcriptional regulator with XRE-family HTH domain
MNKQAPGTLLGKRVTTRSAIHEDPAFQAGRQLRVELVRLGGFLKSVRERAGLTQAEVADLAGFSQPEICRLETASAQNGPEYGTVLRYLEACRVSLTVSLTEKASDRLVKFVDGSALHSEGIAAVTHAQNGAGRSRSCE